MGRRSKNKNKNQNDSINNNNNKRKHPPDAKDDNTMSESNNKSNKRRRYNNNKKRSSSSSSSSKKRQKFWIEDCMESNAPQNQQQDQDPSSSSGETTISKVVTVMDILITRSDLVDDYRQVPQRNESGGDDPKTVIMTATTITNATPSDEVTGVDVADDGTQNDCEETSSEKVEEQPKSADDGDNQDKSSSNETVPTCDDTNSGKQTVESTNVSNDVFIAVKRSKSVKRPMNVRSDQYQRVENFKPLPHGDCGDGITNPHPKDEVPDKFWSQRRRLFTRFDDGIQLDKESWYSVTPEAIAVHIAGHLTANRQNVVILDPFCGCGGNAIQFALQDAVDIVVCVDKDLSKLEMAASNASIYGVPPTKMIFIHDHASHVLSCYHDCNLMKVKESLVQQMSNVIDWIATGTTTTKKNSVTTHGGFRIGGIELLPNRIDCIFLSPPWGGIDYAKVGKRNYTLKCIQLESNNITQDCESNNNSSTTTSTTTAATTAATTKMIDGDDILLESSRALGRRGPIALFLPKNINGVALGKSVVKSGYPGPIILEQNVLNGKLKTVTAYIGLH